MTTGTDQVRTAVSVEGSGAWGRWCGRVGGFGVVDEAGEQAQERAHLRCGLGAHVGHCTRPALPSYSTLFLLLAGLLVVDRLAQ
ncbi:hypothetical protein [Microbacterium arborescens]